MKTASYAVLAATALLCVMVVGFEAWFGDTAGPPHSQEPAAGPIEKSAIDGESRPPADVDRREAQVAQDTALEAQGARSETAAVDRDLLAGLTSRQKRARALERAKRLAEGSGLEWADQLDLAESEEREVVAAFTQFMKELQQIDKVRMPVVQEIADGKIERGLTEQLKTKADLPSDLDGPARAAWIASMHAQHKPTRDRQTVIRGGAGANRFLVRVDAEEDHRLVAAYDSIAASERDYLQRVLSIVNKGR